jgi:hypothetical protein
VGADGVGGRAGEEFTMPSVCLIIYDKRLANSQVAEFESWENASPKEGDGVLRWEWETEGLWLGIMVRCSVPKR